jgi:hypothetical protein
MGDSRVGHLSRESRQPNRATATRQKTSGAVLNLQRTSGNNAVTGLLRPLRASATAAAELSSSLPGTRSHSFGDQAVQRLIAGAAAPPEVIAHSNPDESAAQALASAVMRMGEPEGPRAIPRASVSGGLDADTRSFFEPRFGHDFSRIRVHATSAAAQSASRLGAAAYTIGTDIVMGTGHLPGRNLVTAHELAHVVRGDAVGRLCRAPGGPDFKIISKVWRVAGRDIVLVSTGSGNQVLSFYLRTGKGYKGEGLAPAAGKWVPFKTLMEQSRSPRATVVQQEPLLQQRRSQ